MNTSAHPTIALLQSHSLAGVVQQSIEQAILSGSYPPGAKLNESIFAEQLGVSRGPVREAFRMLDEAGLVRTAKNRGVFVRDITLAEAAEIFEVRAALEEMVGRQLASHANTAQLTEMNGMLDAMQQAVQASNADDYHQLNLQFHDRLVEMTGNSRLLAIYRKLIKELSLYRRLNLGHTGAMPTSVQGHRQIVQAITSGNTELAGRAMANHVQGSKQRTMGQVVQIPPTGHTSAITGGNTEPQPSIKL
jgi:phosphonate utilization transcriptional regulator